MNDYEINLIDYVKVILKCKKLIFFIFVLAIIIAFILSILSPKIYSIDTTLELGQAEALVQLVEKINNGVYNKKRASASGSKNTQLVKIKIESADYNEAKSALEEINNLILKEHNADKIKNKISLLDQDIRNNQNKIEKTKDKKNLADNDADKIKNKIITSQDDIKRIYNKISSTEKEKQILRDKIDSLEAQLIFEQTPGTQFALFSAKQELESTKQGIENLYLQINSLQRLVEDYSIQINALEKEKRDIDIQINNLELEINALNKFLQEIEPTKIIKQPTVSKSSIKPRPMLNMAIAGVLGLFVGVFLAFAKEWWKANS